VTAVGTFVPPMFGYFRIFRPEPTFIARRELVPEASIYNETASPLELIPNESTSSLRTMCGSRTGGWSLPCLMSD
jgi:hypothetical protein